MGERRDHYPAGVIKASHIGPFKAGMAANFQIFSGRSFSELLARRQVDRLVIRNGAPIDTTLPDYRDLDRIIENSVVFRGNPFVSGIDARSIQEE